MIIDVLNEAPAPFRGTEIHTLANGLKLILKEDHTVPVVSVQAWARCGAVNETPNIYGISHALEHMVFKGSPDKSTGDISRIIESQGGSINAATQLETTHYYFDIPSYGLEPAMNALFGTILNPAFPADELAKEKLVIIEEIRRRADSPEATLWDEFTGNLFHNTPYGIKVIGSEKTVSDMKRDDLMQFYGANYTPSNLSIVISGDFDKADILKKCKRTFDGLERKKAPETPRVDTKEWQPQTQVIKKPVQMTYIAAGFPAPGLDSKDMMTLDILSDILGGSPSSRFFQKMREDSQSVLSISCDYIPFKQKGIFGFFMDTVQQKADSALHQLFKEIKRVKDDPIKPSELARAKARTKSDWLFGSETPRGQASTLGSLSALGQIDLINRYLSRVDSLTVDELMDVYDRYLKDQRFTVTRVQPQ